VSYAREEVAFKISPPCFTRDACVIRLQGELDTAACPVLEEAAARLLETPGLRRLVLDLSAVSAIDTAGLGLLVDLRRALRDRGGTLALAHMGLPVARALRLTHLAGLFQIVP
jgi:anti-sigma B factor antagonist